MGSCLERGQGAGENQRPTSLAKMAQGKQKAGAHKGHRLNRLRKKSRTERFRGPGTLASADFAAFWLECTDKSVCATGVFPQAVKPVLPIVLFDY